MKSKNNTKESSGWPLGMSLKDLSIKTPEEVGELKPPRVESVQWPLGTPAKKEDYEKPTK